MRNGTPAFRAEDEVAEIQIQSLQYDVVII